MSGRRSSQLEAVSWQNDGDGPWKAMADLNVREVATFIEYIVHHSICNHAKLRNWSPESSYHICK